MQLQEKLPHSYAVGAAVTLWYSLLHTLAMFVGSLSVPVMQVFYHSFHDDGATHAAIITDTAPADNMSLYRSERCHLVYVSISAILVA